MMLIYTGMQRTASIISNQYTSTFNVTGWPGVVVRCGTSRDGLPIGLQVIGRPWHEHVALAAGALLERELVGWQMPIIK